ncbi:hypothetical protein H257_08518 [Aphanomyces astaci]|uniref:Uncharacterized protein n=1 Tax=Aphanomyces astaci TaxID=112090 RepID=W4GD52_APHAT|nr:hypothetical protein H257_08518 [Aphanomyces astaci]ETV77607.1 hypothetical protein H257_08518 [Aphanomyces astaci]|eukprot:XP_009832717.1 hypothetical protein H257_08518 [Aphanomyces astaci]
MELTREMLWSLGSPEQVISRCSVDSIVEWGQHLLASCYHTMQAAKRLTTTALHQQTLDDWRRTSSDASIMDEALRVGLDPSAWHDYLPPPTDYSAIFTPVFLTDLSPSQILWFAIIGLFR